MQGFRNKSSPVSIPGEFNVFFDFPLILVALNTRKTEHWQGKGGGGGG